jgi:anaphase-promoting complex subunit 6
LSVDPINPHVLELLNTALESSVTKPLRVAHNSERNQAVQTLKSKYTAWQDKGKERAHAEMVPSSGIGSSTSAPDEMNIG